MFAKRSLVACILVMSTLLATSTSAAFTLPFDHQSEYTVIEPVSVQLVYIAETDRYGLNHFNGQFGQLWQTAEAFHEAKDWLLSHRGFDVDSRKGDLPSQREQFNSYDDEFFSQYHLLWLAYEGFFQGEALIPTDPPELDTIYLQNDAIHISDSVVLPIDRRDDIPGFEYHMFICLEKDTVSGISPNNVNCVSYLRFNSVNAPQTSDPTTPLAITAASALTALCLVPVACRKRKTR